MSNPKKQIRNIYGYCRVSTIEQSENGISIDTQKELISEFVKEKFNKEVNGWFADSGVSGTVPILEREQCRAMTDVMDEYDIIVATRMDRLSRSCKDLMATIPHFEECGVTFYLCEQFGDMPIVYPKEIAAKGLNSKYDMNALVNQIMLMVLSAVAEMEFETRKKLVEVPEEQAVIKTIHQCKKRGLGVRRIAKQVANTHAGFENFSPNKVDKILNRKFQGLGSNLT